MIRKSQALGIENGSYYAVISVLDEKTGKRKRRWIAAGSDKKLAQQRLTKELAALDAGAAIVNTNRETLGSFLPRWLDLVQVQLSARTREGYETIIRRVVQIIGHYQLRKVSPAILQQYFSCLLGESGRVDGKTGGLSPLTVVHHHRLLHRAFEDAVRWGLLSRNPTSDVRTPKNQNKDIAFMTKREVGLFLNAAKDTDYYALFYIFIETGARRSEVLALKWSDYDPAHGTLSIQRSLHRLHGGKIVTQNTKTPRSKRLITLGKHAVEY